MEHRFYSQVMRWIVLGMAMWLSGCSLVFVSGPPSHHQELPYFTCTESRVAPVLDTVLAVLEGANSVYAAAVDDQKWADNYDGNPPFARSTAIPVYAVGALLAAGSAYYGFRNTGECREALAMRRRQHGGFGQQQWTPSPYAPPPAPDAPPTASPYAPPPAPSPYAPPPAPSPYVPPPAPSPYVPPPYPYGLPQPPAPAPSTPAPPPAPSLL